MNSPKYIDKRSKEAYWVQLYHALHDDIIDGSVAAGTRLPTAKVLADQQGMDVSDVEKALDKLIKEQLLERQGDEIVAYAKAVDPQMFDRVTNLTNVIESRSKVATFRDLSVEKVAYDPNILPEAFIGMSFYRIRRIFSADSTPVFYLDSYFDVKAMPSLADKSPEETMLYKTLYAQNNIQDYRSDRLIQTLNLPSDIAKVLNAKPGIGCIKTTISAYQGDQLFEYTLVWQLAEEFIFEYRMDLKD
jgi:DNA-binding GntR family transcriptional regulator